MTATVHNRDFADAIPQNVSLTEVDTLRQMSAFYLSYGRAATAEKLLRIVVWLNPNDAEALRLKARALALLGRPGKAAELLLRLRKSRSGNVTLSDWKAVGVAFIRAGQIKNARAILFRK